MMLSSGFALLVQTSLLGAAYAAAVNSATTSTIAPPITSNTDTGTTTNTVIVSGTVACSGCDISIQQTYLTYPFTVAQVVATSTKTIIPYVTSYANGSVVTQYSTYAQFTANKTSAAFIEPTTSSHLVWTAYGTVLTYPTTYIAFPSASAGYSSAIPFDSLFFCSQPSFTNIPVPTADISSLIFASTTDIAGISASVSSYYENLPAVTSVLGGGDPHKCNLKTGKTIGWDIPQTSSGVVIGGDTNLPDPTSSPQPGGPSPVTQPKAVTHTSVSILTTTWAPIVTSISGQTPLKDPGLGGLGTGSGQNLNNGADVASGSDTIGSGTTPAGVPDLGSSKPADTGASNGSGGSSSGSHPGSSSGSGSSNTGSNSGSNSGSNTGSGSVPGSNSGSGSSSGSPNSSGETKTGGNSGSNSGSNPGSNQGGLGGVILSGLGLTLTANTQQQPTSQAQQETHLSESLRPAQQPVTIGSRIVSVAAATTSGAIILGGLITISPGQTTTVNGVAVGVATNGRALVIGGSSTVDITASGFLSSMYEPVLTFGSAQVTANAMGDFVFGSSTLRAGGIYTVDGTTIALATTGGVAVVNGETQTMTSALAEVTVTGEFASVDTSTPTGSIGYSGAIGAQNTGTSSSSKGTSAGTRQSSVVALWGSFIAVSLTCLLFL